jgi:hypothetical protein
VADPSGVVQVRIAGHGTASEESTGQPIGTQSPVKIELAPVAPGGTKQSRLRRSFEALGRVRSSKEPADWLEAASVLKADAVRFRNSTAARHSAVLLAAADALTFTDPSDPTLDPTAQNSLVRALSLLSEPFIAERAEEDFLVALIQAGWNLAPAVDIDLAIA